MKLKDIFFKKKGSIIVSVLHGLGNRLRALASAKLLADVSKSRFVLVWCRDNHCN